MIEQLVFKRHMAYWSGSGGDHHVTAAQAEQLHPEALLLPSLHPDIADDEHLAKGFGVYRSCHVVRQPQGPEHLPVLNDRDHGPTTARKGQAEVARGLHAHPERAPTRDREKQFEGAGSSGGSDQPTA